MAKPLLPDSVIRTALQARWGAISALGKLAEGFASQAYSFRHNDADNVARIDRSSCRFRKDAFVCRRFARPSLPVPEVVDSAQLDDGHVVCISRRAQRVRVHDIVPAELRQIIGAMVETMTEICASDLAGTQGFGCFDANGRGPHRTWKEFRRPMSGDALLRAWRLWLLQPHDGWPPDHGGARLGSDTVRRSAL